MSTLADYYEKNAFFASESPAWSNFTRDVLIDHQVLKLSLEEESDISFTPLFSILRNSYCANAMPNGVNMPLLIPGDRDDQGTRLVEGRTIRDIVEGWVGEKLSRPRYLMCCDPAVNYAYACNAFSYELLDVLTSGLNNNSFALFDSAGQHQITFDDDLAITMIISCGDCSDLALAGKDRSFWNDYFRVEFLSSVVGEHHLNVFNTHFAPFVPGIGRLSFPPLR